MTLKALQTDGTGEYVATQFQKFLVAKGIARRQTCAYTPQQNGVSERMNRALLKMVSSMLKQNNLKKYVCVEAAITAACLKNRVTCREVPVHKTPYNVWHI